MVIAGAFFLQIIALAAAWRYLRGDRARDKRRCPKCWYDMAGLASRRCPECGRAAPTERHLHRTRRSAWVGALALGLTFGAFSLVVFVERPKSWTELVPRPVLAWILEAAAPDSEPREGDEIPWPAPRPSFASTPWEHMIWRETYAKVIRRWGDLVATGGAALASDADRLVRVVRQLNRWQHTYEWSRVDISGSLVVGSSWIVDREVERQLLRLQAMDRVGATNAFVTGSEHPKVCLARAEFFMLAFEFPPLPPGPGQPAAPPRPSGPVELLVAMTAAPRLDVRLFAIEHLTWQSSADYDIRGLLQSLSRDEKEEVVQQRAAKALMDRGLLGIDKVMR